MPSALLDEARFRNACARFATGVAVAAVIDDSGQPQGLTINSFTSVSLCPPLVLICIDERAAILPHFLHARRYGVSVLAETQSDLSNRFAARVDDRFDGIPWRVGQFGVPLLDGAVATFECEMRSVIEGGDHLILLAETLAADAGEAPPLLYFRSTYGKLA